MLKLETVQFYKTKQGQTLREIADAFSVSERLLAQENGLRNEPFAGQILRIPNARGNAYTVQVGDTKELLAGSPENYRAMNGTDVFYLGMRIRIK
ncbi:MAG: LysM peptidoglycan-binding domain-containing protein [Clostridia bacterium]|nr:LysM peptidoglycan-binding domain-containing protein [Clostridia bacterium]